MNDASAEVPRAPGASAFDLRCALPNRQPLTDTPASGSEPALSAHSQNRPGKPYEGIVDRGKPSGRESYGGLDFQGMLVLTSETSQS